MRSQWKAPNIGPAREPQPPGAAAGFTVSAPAAEIFLAASASENSSAFQEKAKGSIYPYEFLLRHPYSKLRANALHLQ